MNTQIEFTQTFYIKVYTVLNGGLLMLAGLGLTEMTALVVVYLDGKSIDGSSSVLICDEHTEFV